MAVLLGATSFGLLVASFVVQPWEVGSAADWIAGLGSFAAVAVALWQSVVIRRQSEKDAIDAADRFQKELDAAKERHEAQMEAQREVTREQVEAQVELARVQRVHLREQEFKLSLVRVSKSAGAYTHELATLVEEGRLAAKLPTKPEREAALLPLAKKLGALVQDFSVELAGAHMLTRNNALHEALNEVNAALMAGPYVEMAFRNRIQDAGEMPHPAPIYAVMEGIQTALGDARQAAGDLLDTGWE